ncbi:MAG: hypothetical protein DHS20C18_44780 [Saprospiraceae bacterium]|nr:MAG: hypothetical protein DHS20C18_44780 [Saprospiraceae bacterium]
MKRHMLIRLNYKECFCIHRLKSYGLNVLLTCCLITIGFPGSHYGQANKWQTAYDAIPNSPDSLRFQMLKDLGRKTVFSDPVFTSKLISEQETIAKRHPKLGLLADVYRLQGIYQNYHGDVDSSIYFFGLARDYYENRGLRDQEAMMENNIGIILRKKGAYGEALHNHFAALRIFEELTDSASISKVHNALGSVYYALGENNKAEEHFRKVLAYSEQVENEASKADALSNIAMTLENREVAIDLNMQAVAIYKRLNMTYKMMASMGNIGRAYQSLGKYDQAIKYYERIQPLAKEMESEMFYAELLRDMGVIYSKLGNYAKAVPNIERAAFLFDSLNQLEVYTGCIKNLYEVQAEAGKFEDAYQIVLKYIIHNDSVKSLEVLHNISELETKYETEKKDNEIALLSKNAELDQVKNTRLWIVLISSLLLGALLFWLHRTRILNQKVVETERRKVAELKNQQLHLELDFKKQELASKALQLCRKNEFLHGLDNKIKTLKSDSSGVNNKQINKLSQQINRDLNADEDWEKFLKSFEMVHSDFNKKINKVHPDFTAGEYRMACLLKMNLDTKGIANLLNISPEGVKKVRYRMRKKMNVEQAKKMNEYFLKF